MKIKCGAISCVIMALVSSKLAHVTTGSKLHHKHTKYLCTAYFVTWLWSYNTRTHTHYTRAPLLDMIGSMSCTMNVNFIFMLLHIALCISVVPTLSSVEPTVCAKAILGIL